MKKSRTYGLIGKNIDYSFSKKYFSKKFEVENLDCIYSNFDIKNLSQIESVLQKDEISGFNVTIPYKEEIIKFLDEIDEVATAIGAVNTIKKIDNKDKNLDEIISSYKPPIFWKDKDIVKNQASKWNLKDTEKLISNINEIELSIKKNYANSLNIVSDFIINTAK